MRTVLLTTLLTLAALNAAAETRAFTHDDPLTKHIMSGLVRGSGEITGGSRGVSGETIPIKMDPLSLSVGIMPLRDAVAEPDALKGLKPTVGLTAKAPKKQAPKKDPRKAKAQLQKVSAEKRWPGRK